MPIPDTSLQAVQLGALLHDIGKLFQRSGLRPSANYHGFTTRDYGNHGAHAKWSADFVERHLAGRWPIRPHDILTHHLQLPPSRTAKLIALADRMSAGEREDEETETRPPWEAQLLSIFSRLALADGPYTHDGYYPLKPLELSRDCIFPEPGHWKPEVCRKGYLELWNSFEAEFARLDKEDYPRYLEGLYHLLHRFCWCVPSAAYHQTPDVSLFDHSRLTGAIATCLYLDDLSEEQVDRLLAWPPRQPDRAQPLMLLVGGDISGLQDYLYTLSAKGAARTLRGRSLYLQLLTESAARFLLRQLGLPALNAIYWGGGHFNLLVPASLQETLENGCSELEKIVLELHGGDLSIAVGWVHLSADDFERDSFAARWSKVGAKIAEAKDRRFGQIIRNSYQQLFAPTESGGTRDRCEACHKEIDSPVEEKRCPTCLGMEQLGLRVARVLAERKPTLSVGDRPPSGQLSQWQEALGRFGCWWDFGEGGDGAFRYTLNSTGFLDAGADGFRWMPAVIPRLRDAGQGRIKDFSEIADDSLGIDRLGVLRMDVDDLGSLFATGFSSPTASRVASLSSALRLFFEGWINRLALEVERDTGILLPEANQRSGLLYGVYSGGDDLFLVGAWDRIPILARRIKADLAEYAVGNPAVRISAGIALVDAHLPLYQAAGDAHEELERKAKGHLRKDDRSKDAVTFLGETLGWEEFDPIHKQVIELARLVGRGEEGGKVPRSLLSMLSALYRLYIREATRQAGRCGMDPERLYYGRWTWMAAYWLGRARERTRDEAAKSALAALQKRLGEPSEIRRLGLVARWAEYLTRSREVYTR